MTIVKRVCIRYFLRVVEPAEQILQRLIAERLAELGTNAFAVEQKYSLPEGAVRSILSGSKKLGTTLNRAQAICDVLGLEITIGPHRDAPPPPPIIVDGTEYARIPLHEATLAAGRGAANDLEWVADHLAFSRAWLKRVGISPAAAVLARASGDSMSPTIHDGDLVLIDRAAAAPPAQLRARDDRRPARIFALLDAGAARVKRLDLAAPGTLALLSDNPEYPPEFRPLGEVQVIGRVLWWGHTDKG